MLITRFSRLGILSTSRPHLVLSVPSLLIIWHTYTQELNIHNLNHLRFSFIKYCLLLKFHHLKGFQHLHCFELNHLSYDFGFLISFDQYYTFHPKVIFPNNSTMIWSSTSIWLCIAWLLHWLNANTLFFTLAMVLVLKPHLPFTFT